MIGSNEVFLLIKSLSRNEKGYFKKYSSKHTLAEGNFYVELFDELDAQEEYNEEKIKKQLGKKRVKNFPSEKNYLYKLILRSLNEFYHNNSIERELRDLLNSVELLFAKSLYKQCEKFLLKAEKLALRFEKYSIQLEITDWRTRVIVAQAKFDELKNFIPESEKSKNSAIEKYKNLSEYRVLEGKMLMLTKTLGYPRTKAESEKYRQLIQTPVLRSKEKALGFWAQFHFYNIFNFYYDAIGKKDKLYEYRKKLIDFAESDKEKINDDQIRYLVALNNLVNIQDELAKDEEVYVTLDKIRSVKSRSAEIQIRIFTYVYTMLFTRNIIRGDFEKNTLILPEVEEGLRKYSNKMHKEFLLAIRYNCFYTFFGTSNFSASLKWLNQILNDRYIESRKDIYSSARIMYLILHYELGNADLLTYAIESTKRYFKKQERLFRFEEFMLRFIEKIAPLSRRAEEKKVFQELKEKLIEIKKDALEIQVVAFFDFDSWVEAKLSGKTFAETVRESVAANFANDRK
ncbi:MAG: hypothetical protein IAF38_20300 [Bacteroidia bacterium]|nr:hypothetical protein [Bacteroidia bacterium]